MFDIGFAELILIAVVGLLVIGPERLPGTIRMASVWLNRMRRSFDDIKREVQQELHNDAVMQDLRKTGQDIKSQAERLGQDIKSGSSKPAGPGAAADKHTPASSEPVPPPKSDE